MFFHPTAISGAVLTRLLLQSDEPDALEVVNAVATRGLLLVCEHAGKLVPRPLIDDYDPVILDTHYGCDIGAGALTRALAHRLQATAVCAHYSRLVIDANRRLDDPTLVLPLANGEPVTANTDLSAAQLRARIHDLYLPVHARIEQELSRLSALSPPVYVAVHSFTPELRGQRRPWHVGVMWDRDARLAEHMLTGLRKHDGLKVGANEPYSGRAPEDFSVDYHAERNGLINVALEIRQDLLGSAAQVQGWVERLAPLFETALAAPWPRTENAPRSPSFYPDVSSFETAARQWMAV